MKKNNTTQINIISQRILVLASLIALGYSFYYSFAQQEFLLLFISFLVGKLITTNLATQIILHRYFSHRSFETNAITHKIFCWLSILAGQGSPVAWAAHHRHHHLHADTDLDTHSPKESKLLAAGLWLLKSYDYYLNVKKLKRVPTDLLRDPTTKFVDKYYYLIWFLVITIFLVIDPKITVFFILAPLAWGYFNAAFITLLAHIKLPYSYRNFDTDDQSYNNKFLQMYMFGEGLHNNHHKFPNRYNEALNSGEFDIIGWVIEKLFIKSK